MTFSYFADKMCTRSKLLFMKFLPWVLSQHVSERPSWLSIILLSNVLEKHFIPRALAKTALFPCTKHDGTTSQSTSYTHCSFIPSSFVPNSLTETLLYFLIGRFESRKENKHRTLGKSKVQSWICKVKSYLFVFRTCIKGAPLSWTPGLLQATFIP